MRILITPEGKTEIVDLANKKYRTTNLIYPKLNKSKSCMNITKRNPEYESYEDRKKKEQKLNKIKKSWLMNTLYNRNEAKVNLKEVAKAKKVNVGGMKLNDAYRKMFPNSENESEEKLEKTQEKISTFFKSEKELAEQERIKNMQELMYNEKKNKNELLPITNILPKKVIDDLEHKFIGNLKSKYENKKLTENEFRTVFHEQVQPLINLDDSLKLKIKADRLNLISYLKSKKEITPIYLQNLRNYDQEKIMKANKICQILLHNKEITNKRNELMNQKILADKDSFRVKTLKRVHSLDNYNLCFANEILKEYYNKKTIKDANKTYFRNKLKELYDKHWNNNFLNRQYEKIKKTQNVNKFLEDNSSFYD